MKRAMQFPATDAVQLGGLLGRALAANHDGRLTHFITDAASPAIALFGAAHRQKNEEGDWYGEHAGKWLVAAAKAARRTRDPALKASVQNVADYLVSQQEPDGYLGTYAPSRRFMRPQPAGPRTWDGAPGARTWDIWTHSYLILGMLEASALFSSQSNATQPGGHGASGPGASAHDASSEAAQRYLECARRIGDLCWRTLTDGGIDITALGNHFGLSATVLLDPAVELYFATQDEKYLGLARLILHQANRRAELRLQPEALAGTDAAYIGTGKSYQLCWNLVGMAKLYRATGDAQLLTAVRKLWDSIHASHLTLGGGPWGGVALRSREIFNPPGVFSPHGYVETCAILAWLQLNRELLGITGEARYAEEIERTACNDLLGAQAPNGTDWCYYSFPNGQRVFTTYWRCCKSSGSMALEELPSLACSTIDAGLAVNLYGEGVAQLETTQAGSVRLEQTTRYPFGGGIRIVVTPQRPAKFAILLRIPSWAGAPAITINEVDSGAAAAPGHYVALERHWQKGDEIAVTFAMTPALHVQSSRNVQESKGPDGEPISQEVMRYDHVAITRGPLVYATGLVDGFRTVETVCLADNVDCGPDGGAQPFLEVVDAPQDSEGPAIRMNVPGRPPLIFTPYFEAGGRTDGAWRLTWMQLAPGTRTRGPQPRKAGVK